MRLHFQTQLATSAAWLAALALLLLPLLGCTKPANAFAQTKYQAIKNFVDLGSNPTSLIEGSDRNLYGTMRDGGSKWEGVVFKVNKDGSGYRLVHSFTGYENSGDGAEPSGLALGSDGALYGTTEFHGRNNGGTAFKLNPDGSGFAVLHNFPGAEGDGQNPSASMVQGSDGALYGMTKTSNTNSFATLFKLSSDAFAQHLEP